MTTIVSFQTITIEVGQLVKPLIILGCLLVDDMVTKFANNEDAGVNDVIENLIYLKNLYNKETEVIVDSEYVYIKKAA